MSSPDADVEDVVVLVADDGTPVGTAPRLEVHGQDTPLHLAFSTYLYDELGRLLVTRRALDKRTWPGVWSNSSCGHLRPGESAEEAVVRRVTEELGATPRDLVEVLPDFRYRAVDAGGVVENELCPVLIGRVDTRELRPDRAEIAEWSWVDWDEIVRTATTTPALLSPWAVLQIRQLAASPAMPRGAAAPPAQPVRRPSRPDRSTP